MQQCCCSVIQPSCAVTGPLIILQAIADLGGLGSLVSWVMAAGMTVCSCKALDLSFLLTQGILCRYPLGVVTLALSQPRDMHSLVETTDTIN